MEAWSGMADMPPRRILRPELFGCGGTAPWPGDRPLRMDYVVDLICRMLSDVSEPIDLVGHSYGGAVAL
ncbi:MAG: alpha/beta hydrolase, partial [Ferrovibrio sp.]